MSVLAIIPARAGSKGIPGKNLRKLGGVSLMQRAYECAYAALANYPGLNPIVISTDIDAFAVDGVVVPPFEVLWRPPELAQDDTPMIAVVQHVLEQIPGPEDQIIVLLQPTQPFRTPAHVHQAITILEAGHAIDSVVSVVELPPTHHPACALLFAGRLTTYDTGECLGTSLPTRRQEVGPAYIRDGTVYAFRRSTVKRWGDIYGLHALPLIIPPDESCELDTEDQWADVQRRWATKHA